MKVQLLWFSGCPNVDSARSALRDAMARVDIAESIEEIDVSAPTTPAELRNWGSPTILIDGTDVGGQLAADGASCRLYAGARVPSVDTIERALRAASNSLDDKAAVNDRDLHRETTVPLSPATAGRNARTRRLAGASAIVAALAASACCIGPAILALLGLSGAGLAAALSPWRPVFLGITGVLVALGLYLASRRRAANDCGCPAPRARRAGAWMFLLVAGIAVVLAAYPWFLDPARRGGGDAIHATAIAYIEIDGITCADCADGIVRKLGRVHGVGDVTIDTDRGVATIHFDPASTTAEALASVISELPQYKARVAGTRAR